MKKSLFGMLTHKTYPLRLLAKDGVIRLQAANARAVTTTVGECEQVLKEYLAQLGEYGEGGEKTPEVYLLLGARIVDFSRLVSSDQIVSLQRVELVGESLESQVTAIFALKSKR